MNEEKYYDVVIIGAGPAGLLAATWMAQTGVKTLLVEKKPQRTLAGHADGLESRTLEILDSFGIGSTIWEEANRTIEVCLWSGSKGGIKRDEVSSNHAPGLSRFQEVTLGQGRIEEHLLGFIKQQPAVEIRWETVPTYLDIDTASKVDMRSSYPIRLDLASMQGAASNNPQSTVEQSKISSVRAKYLIGCDGAHSWTRKSLGLSMEGETTNMHWGVIDCIPITCFPDIRKRCIIKSNSGNVMIIPREGKLVRFYIQLSAETAAKFREDWHPSALVEATQRILRPYAFMPSRIDWATIYTVGQRVCETLSVNNRIFLAGDAIHTHSPKAGQGMNVSMQDAYNLGWKLALVINRMSHPKILQTYQKERLPVAKRLISFDQRMCHGVCSTSKSQESLRAALREENSSASGMSVIYSPGLLVTPTQGFRTFCQDSPRIGQSISKGYLATNIAIGMRLASYEVLRQSDSSPWHLQELLTSTGQWTLFVFGGDITDPAQRARLDSLAESLASDSSFFSTLNRAAGINLVGSIRIYLVHCAHRHRVEFTELPELFRPFDPVDGIDYGRVFADNQSYGKGCGDVFRSYGISSRGCVVLLRPDQHVAYIGELEDTAAMEIFFSNIRT